MSKVVQWCIPSKPTGLPEETWCPSAWWGSQSSFCSQIHYQIPFFNCFYSGDCPPCSSAPTASPQIFCLRGSVHPKLCSQCF